MHKIALGYFIFLSLIEVYHQCIFWQYSYCIECIETSFQKLEISNMNSKNDLGLGLWFRYQPFSTYPYYAGDEELISYNRNIFYQEEQIMFRKEESFIFSILHQQLQTSSVILTLNFNQSTLKMQHNLYIDFEHIVQQLSIDFDAINYEGTWIIFYIFFDQGQKQTTLGIFNIFAEEWKMITILGLPKLSNQYELHVGGNDRIEQFSKQFYLFKKFYGIMTKAFTSGMNNYFELQIILDCYHSFKNIQQYVGDYIKLITQNFDGTFYKDDIVHQLKSFDEFTINGWVKLKALTGQERNSTIFSISQQMNALNAKSGDRLFYLIYYQNINPELNGFEFTLKTFIYPIPTEYNNLKSATLSYFNKQFSQLCTQWHKIQFNAKLITNNYQPVFSIFSYEIGHQQFKWKELINYSSEPTLEFFFGGDQYSKTYLKGQLSQFTIFLQNNNQADEIINNCYQTCETCYGPTEDSCLTCPQNSKRIYDEFYQTCQCDINYIDIEIARIKACYNIFTEYDMTIFGELPSNKCNFGFFEANGVCIICPFYEIYENRTSILCADCYLNPKEFSINLKCTYDYFSYDNNKENVYMKKARDQTEIEAYHLQFQELTLIQNKNLKECQNGYFFINQKCITISNCANLSIIQNFILQCFSCQEGYFLINNKCEICGRNCLSCDSYGDCYFCKDPSKYYLSFDGQNCNECRIENCLYCFSYYYLNNNLYSTLNENFEMLHSSYKTIFEGCALCVDGYFFNFQSNYCELKCSSLATIQEKSVCINQFDDCLFGVVSQDNILNCLKSVNSSLSISSQSCSQYENCLECLNSNQQTSTSKCIVCKIGYYAEINTGICVPCPKECSQCAQENYFLKDYWRQQTLSFQLYLNQSNVSDGYYKYAQNINLNYLEIVCFECSEGFRPDKNQCIKDCGNFCKKCEVIDGISVCKQCLKARNGYLKAKNSEEQCIECPNYCAACIERSLEEIHQLNPQFLVNQSNIRFTRKCYQLFETKSDDHFFFINQQNQVVMCEINLQKCYNKIAIKKEFYTRFHSDNLKQYPFDDLFTSYPRNYLWETEQVNYLNQVSAQEILIQFSILSNEDVVIENNTFVCTSIQQNVFSLKNITADFLGNYPGNSVQFPEYTQFFNFTKVSFTNITFILSSFHILNFQTLVDNFELQFFNCIFISKSNTFDSKFIQIFFTVNKPYSLIFENVVFQNLIILNSVIFSPIFNKNQKQSITIKNFTIRESQFINTTLFSFINEQDDANFTMLFSDLLLQSSNFTQFSFLLVKSYSSGTDSSVHIDKATLINTYFTQSVVFFESTIAQFFLTNFEVQLTTFEKNTNFFTIFCIHLQNVIFKNISNFNSTFAMIEVNKQLSSNQGNVTMLCNNISFYNIQTDNQKPFIKQYKTGLIQYFSIYFNTVIIQNIYSNIQVNNQRGFIQLQCDVCKLSDVIVTRSYGITELAIDNSIQIELSNIMVQQQKQKVLHALFECAPKIITLSSSFLVISSYSYILIDKLQMNFCIAFNVPLLQFLGKDEKTKIQNEKVKILNSKFAYNKNFMMGSQKTNSIIYLSTNQFSEIILSNISFIGNILHSYNQKTEVLSSSTIFIDANNGYVQLTDGRLIQNTATNCSGSNLYISSFQTLIKNFQFVENNILNQFAFLDNLLIIEKIKDQVLYNLFPIKSKGGNGQIISNNLIIQNITMNSSQSDLGGCFYISTSGDGNIHIKNSIFYDSSTSFLNSSESQGGCFYVDSSKSKLNLTITKLIINSTQSLKEGGAIYIIPSYSQNQILLSDMVIIDSFSIKNSFLAYKSSFFQTSKSQILMANIKFIQNQGGFDQFYSKIIGLSSNYLPSPMIFISYGNVTLQNLTLNQSILQYFINIEAGEFVYFKQIVIYNGSLINSRFMKIGLSKNQTGQIIFQQVFIKNIKLFQEETLNSFCDQQQESYSNEVSCYKGLDDSFSTQIVIVDNSKAKLKNLLCNKQIIISDLVNINSFIEIEIYNQMQNFLIQSCNFANLLCDYCTDGILNVKLKSIEFGQNIQIKDLIFANNYCGLKGCVNILQDSFNGNVRILEQTQDKYLIYEIQNLISKNQLFLKSSIFKDNTADLGGALFIEQTSSLILECKFISNNALKGGAIYYSSKRTKLQLIDTSISNNNAQFAGGVYMERLVFGESEQLFQVFVLSNNSSNYGHDISENPSSLTISIDGGQTFLPKNQVVSTNQQLIEKIEILQNFPGQSEYLLFPSGIEIGAYKFFDEKTLRFIPLNLTFRIIALNQFNQQETILENSFCILKQKVMNEQIDQEVLDIHSFLSQTNVTFNQSSGDFNLDDLKIQFNPLISKLYYLRIIIQCSMIAVPVYSQDQIQQVINYHSNYTLYVDIQTFPCQLGEYLNYQTGECIICDAKLNFYSLVKNATNCTYKDNNLIDQFTSATIQLRQGYWRAFNESTKIEYCYHLLNNCEGGWLPGDDSCALGHIGALCEQCDINNLRGQGAYSKQGSFSCSDCNFITENIIILILVSFWMILSIFLSVNSTLENIQQEILCTLFYCNRFNICLQNDSLGVLIKFFTNYLQIISIIQTFQLKIPEGLTGFYTKVGNPITQMSYSYDCLLVPIVNIDMNYFRIIWTFTQIFFFIMIFLLIQFAILKYQKRKFKIQNVYTSVLFIYFYIHFSLIGNLMSQMSYRIISDIKWVQGNVSIQYESSTHQLWIVELIIPMLIFSGLFLPLFIFSRIYDAKQNQSNSATLKKWGYAILEFKKETFYWDFVKMFQKSMLVFVHCQYEDFILVKASLIVIILYSFSLTLANLKPYKNQKMNILENTIMKVCSATIILGSCIYLAQDQQKDEISFFCYIVIGYLNTQLLLRFLLLIMQAYFQKFHHIGDYIFRILTSIFPRLLKRYFYLTNLFNKLRRNKQKLKQNYAKVRSIIMPQIKQQIMYSKILIRSELDAKATNFASSEPKTVNTNDEQ